MLPADNERQKLLYGPENYEQLCLDDSAGFLPSADAKICFQLNQVMSYFLNQDN